MSALGLFISARASVYAVTNGPSPAEYRASPFSLSLSPDRICLPLAHSCCCCCCSLGVTIRQLRRGESVLSKADPRVRAPAGNTRAHARAASPVAHAARTPFFAPIRFDSPFSFISLSRSLLSLLSRAPSVLEGEKRHAPRVFCRERRAATSFRLLYRIFPFLSLGWSRIEPAAARLFSETISQTGDERRSRSSTERQ